MNQKINPIPRENMKKLEFLTGMRGLLAFCVLIWHLKENIENYKLFIFHGSLAVGGFFVLSSFLLTYKLMTQFINISIKDFSKVKLILLQYFIRRVFRIIPLYVIIVCFNIYIGFGSELCDLTFSRIIDYLALQRITACWLWTIHPEFYWYFQIPFVAYIAAKMLDRWILFLVGFIGTSLFAFYMAIGAEWNALENVYFTAGSVLAVLYYKTKDNQFLTRYLGDNQPMKQKVVNYFSIFIGLFGYVMFVFYIDYGQIIQQPPVYYYCYAPILLAYFWILWWLPIMITDEETYISKFFQKDTFFYWCGEISFGLYLIHILVKYLVNVSLKIEFQYVEFKYVFEFLLVFLISHFSYKYFEKPLMNLGEKVNKKLQNDDSFNNYISLQ